MKTLPEQIEEIINDHYDPDFETMYVVDATEAILAAFREYVEREIIGEDEEKIKLPVMQIQEQNNYDKEQRNELRAEQRQSLLSGLSEKGEEV